MSRVPASACRHAVETALQKIAADETLNIWSYLAADEARQAAIDSDARLAAGCSRSALEGALVAIKANIAVAGWAHDGGLPARHGLIAQHDAPVIERLRAAGAILLGQTRMDAGALGAEGRSTAGPIRNPHRPTHSVGGSSGGSAAALAAGHCELALGTDTIGSVRIPASYCGISSLKPDHDAVSLAGVLPVHQRFDHVGPMAVRAALLEPLLRVIADSPGTLVGDAQRPPIDGQSFGFLADMPALGVSAVVEQHYRRGLDRLRELGAQLLPIELADLEPARARRAVFTLCEHAMWQQHREALAKQPECYPPQLTAMLQFGGALTDDKLAELTARVEQFAQATRDRLQGLHALVLPTTPTQAFDFSGPTPLDLADLTGIASAAGLPAASVPLAVGDDLPAGLQIIVAEGQSLLACRIATAFEG